MAKIEGGILGPPRGKTGGVVFGAARTRTGKVTTARQKVTPANPQTPAQTAQRNKFGTALDAVRQAGPDIYSVDWNRAIGQLPGFQSLQSIFLGAIQADGSFVDPPDTPLGKLHFPETFDVSASATPGEIDVSWSDEDGDNGTGADDFVLMAFRVEIQEKKSDMRAVPLFATRGDQSEVIANLDSGEDYLVGLYLRGNGAADGLLSLARWTSVTVA